VNASELFWSAWIVASYLLGSVPFGLLIGRVHGVDIRALGSGNIGATNVGRTLGRRWGALCLALDVFKGAAPTLAAGALAGALGRWTPPPNVALLWFAVAAAAVMGHMFPVWLGFRGGKGVATGLGALLCVWPMLTAAAAISLLVWLVSVAISRYVGVSSSLAAGLLPVWIAVLAVARGAADANAVERIAEVWPFLLGSALLAIVVIWKHRGNIARTIAGTEPKSSLFTR